MPLEYGDFLFFLLLVVVIVALFVVFTLGLIAKGELRRQPKKSRENQKEKPSAPPQTKKTKSDDPCINKDKGYHFGFLHKDLDSRTPVPKECLECDLKLECLQGKKPKS